MYACTYLRMHTYMYVRVHACMFTPTPTHTHTLLPYRSRDAKEEEHDFATIFSSPPVLIFIGVTVAVATRYAKYNIVPGFLVLFWSPPLVVGV